jgi:hypothetical protein
MGERPFSPIKIIVYTTKKGFYKFSDQHGAGADGAVCS